VPALSDHHRLLAGLAAAAVYLSGEGVLWLVLLAAVARGAASRSTAPADWRAFAAWALLLGALAGLAAVTAAGVPAPGPASPELRPA
jgi:hypothetical protein